jgi:hypothetical protein
MRSIQIVQTSDLLNIILSALAAGIPVMGAKAWQLITERITMSRVERLEKAVMRQAAIIAPSVVSGATGLPPSQIQDATDIVYMTMHDTVEALGGNREQVGAMIRGEVAKLLNKVA